MKNNIKKILSILCIISLIINGVLGYQLYNSNQKLSQNIVDNTNEKIVSISGEVESLKIEYESISLVNTELNNNDSANLATISTYKNTVKKLNIKINKKNTRIGKLRQRIVSLKSDKKSLQSQIKSLKSSQSSSKSSSSTSSSNSYSDNYSSGGYTVYVTETGSKYHTSGCRYLWNSKIAMSKSEAIAEGYTACSVCNP